MLIVVLLISINNYQNLKALREENIFLGYDLFDNFLSTFKDTLDIMNNEKFDYRELTSKSNILFAYGQRYSSHLYYHSSDNQAVPSLRLSEIANQTLIISRILENRQSMKENNYTMHLINQIIGNLTKIYEELDNYKIDLSNDHNDTELKKEIKNNLRNLKKNEEKLKKIINDIIKKNELLIGDLTKNNYKY